jgi:hypothetical protein
MSPWVRFVEKVFRLPHRRRELERVERVGDELDDRLEILRHKVDPLHAIAMHYIKGDES